NSNLPEQHFGVTGTFEYDITTLNVGADGPATSSRKSAAQSIHFHDGMACNIDCTQERDVGSHWTYDWTSMASSTARDICPHCVQAFTLTKRSSRLSAKMMVISFSP